MPRRRKDMSEVENEKQPIITNADYETEILEKLINSFYDEYIKYIDQIRVLPAGEDGLRTVARRILFCAPKSFTKSATIVGEVIGKYHPHGDQAVYGALVTLVHHGLLIGKGNFGLVGPTELPPAAMRYTEAKLNPSLSILFNFIDAVEHFENELGYKEPKHLPTPIPLLLTAFNSEYASFMLGLGVGYKTKWPVVSKKSAFNIVNGLLGFGPVPDKIEIVTRNCYAIVDNNNVEKAQFKPTRYDNKIFIPQGYPQSKIEKVISETNVVCDMNHVVQHTFDTYYLKGGVKTKAKTLTEIFEYTLQTFVNVYTKHYQQQLDKAKEEFAFWQYLKSLRDTKKFDPFNLSNINDVYRDRIRSVTISQCERINDIINETDKQIKQYEQHLKNKEKYILEITKSVLDINN